jgi:hypothetical protein
MGTWQRGHSWGTASVTSVRSAGAPQWEQNFAPRKINPKQEGHATVASRAPQCSQHAASEAAGAPHLGQSRVSADMAEIRVGLHGGNLR